MCAGGQEEAFYILQKRPKLIQFQAELIGIKCCYTCYSIRLDLKLLLQEIRAECTTKPAKFHLSCLFSLLSLNCVCACIENSRLHMRFHIGFKLLLFAMATQQLGLLNLCDLDLCPSNTLLKLEGIPLSLSFKIGTRILASFYIEYKLQNIGSV